jgi:GNAT superfamily N-acetyltransferase
MRVVRFTDEYEELAAVDGTSADVLRARDRQRGTAERRWIAIDIDGSVIEAVTTSLRPDERLFLKFSRRDLATWPALIEAVVGALGRGVHTFVDTTDNDAVAALMESGFETELVQERFRIRFAEALARVERAWVPDGFRLRPADAVDRDRLFTLDNTLRQDLLGCEGWRGDRDLFREELADSPPFDPDAYPVAIDERNGEYVGLARAWRNADGPRFGLLGVLRQYRNTPVAAALLKQALEAASEWGHDDFVTDTSPTNVIVHPRLKRLGGEPIGRFLQMVRRTQR